MTDRTTAVSRILATSGTISQTDKDAVLNEASRILSKLRGTSPKGDLGILAAALVCMSEDVANRIQYDQTEEVNRLRKELEVI